MIGIFIYYSNTVYLTKLSTILSTSKVRQNGVHFKGSGLVSGITNHHIRMISKLYFTREAYTSEVCDGLTCVPQTFFMFMVPYDLWRQLDMS